TTSRAIKSASITSISNSLNIFAIVLFPVAILPVKPIITDIYLLLNFSDKSGKYVYLDLKIYIFLSYLHKTYMLCFLVHKQIILVGISPFHRHHSRMI